MSFAGWFIAGSIFIIIIIVTMGIGWMLRQPGPALTNKYTAALGWSKGVTGPDPNKNFCQLYQFPTSTTEINGVETVVPGTPTFSSRILDNLQGTGGILPVCIDTDQIVATQQQQTCQSAQGVVEDQITRCYLIEGGTTGIGGTQTFYTNANCLAISPCPGQLSVVSVNFQAPTAEKIFCLRVAEGINDSSTITMEECDPSISQQLFRVTRTNPGINPRTLSAGQGQNGPLAQILDRNSGLCVVPGTNASTTIFNPSFLGNPGCSGPTSSVTGISVRLGTCTGGQFPGYVWMLLPSIRYCSNKGGCEGCTGCTGCTRIQGSNSCSGCQGCKGNQYMITPPQIVYIGNLDISTAPTGTTDYDGLTGDSALFKWLLDNNAKALYYGGGDNNLVLTDMGTDYTICQQKAYSSQYMNIPSYNTIIGESVCYADGTLGTQNCKYL